MVCKHWVGDEADATQCQCSNHYNRKTSTECDIDRHLFCELCVVRRVDDLLKEREV